MKDGASDIDRRMIGLRWALGLSWGELAGRLGISRAMLGFIRKGNRAAGVKLMARLEALERAEEGKAAERRQAMQTTERGQRETDPSLDREEGFWTAEGWLEAHPEYAAHSAHDVGRRARKISAPADLFVGRGRTGTVLTGLALRLAAEAEAAIAGRAKESQQDRDEADAASEYFHEGTYDHILSRFKRKGGSFEAWCRRMGFDDRQARHAVVHPEWRHPAYTRIRKALRAALAELGVQTDL